jgi:hypothetical protein
MRYDVIVISAYGPHNWGYVATVTPQLKESKWHNG